MISFSIDRIQFSNSFSEKNWDLALVTYWIRCHSWSSNNTKAFKVDITGPTLIGKVHGMLENTCREIHCGPNSGLVWGTSTSGCSPKHLCKHLFNQPVLNLSGQCSAQPALFDLYKDELILNTPLQPWLHRSGAFRRAKKKEPIWSWGEKTTCLCVCVCVHESIKRGPRSVLFLPNQLRSLQCGS